MQEMSKEMELTIQNEYQDTLHSITHKFTYKKL